RTFERPEQLGAFLKRLAASHFLDTVRRHRRLRRKEPDRCSLAGLGLQNDPRLTSREPSPGELLEAEETFDQLLAGRPEVHRLVLGLKRIDFTMGEIAVALDMAERSVRRILATRTVRSAEACFSLPA